MFKGEPAVFIAFIMAIVGVVGAFGIYQVTPDQNDAIKAVVTEFFAVMLATGVMIRSNVTPVE